MSSNVSVHSNRRAQIAVNGRYRAHRISGIQRYAHEIASRIGDHFDIIAPERGRGITGHWWEQTRLPSACNGRLLWNPSGSGPAFYRRQVVTIHDLFPIDHPECYSKAYAHWYGVLLRRQVARALHLIAVSEYTKSRIVDRLGCDPQRITVIPNGLTTGCERVEQPAIDKAYSALELPSRRYVLTLSSLEPRKNLRTTLKAWKMVHDRLPSDVWLVIGGPKADRAVYAQHEVEADLPRVSFTGYVPDEHLAGLYSGASLFLFPSLAEGFGIPLLEAMACGVRSITSNTSSLPEVGGDAVTYIDPLDAKALAEAIETELRNGASPDAPAQDAMARAKQFTWDKAAATTRETLERAASVEGHRSGRTHANHGHSSVAITGQVRTDRRAEFTGAVGAPVDGPRVALVHDWLTGMRGGEKVLDILCGLYPDAPLYTLLHVRGAVSATIENRRIRSSLLQKMPRAAEKYRHYLPLFPLFAELNKARDADLVISTSHAVAKAMVERRGNKRPYHICYIHTPMRYAWDMFDDYFGPDRVGALASRYFFRPVMSGLQAYDRRTVDRVDLFLANSSYVAERVRRIYGRDADVLAPPVDTARFTGLEREPEDWYLVVSALVPYKRVDETILACKRLGRRLKIVGSGPERSALQKLAADLGADVEFLGFVGDEELGDYYRRARALLFPGVEDFGIVPVESIACGCPVIALGTGGILDSMTRETAILYNEPTVESLIDAMSEFESRESGFLPDKLRARAAHFSQDKFAAQFTFIAERALHQAFPFAA